MAEDEITYTVPEGVHKVRADKVLAAYFTEFSRAHIQRTFDDQRVLIDGNPLERKTKVSEGDLIHITFLPLKETTIHPVDIPLDILFEDDDIIILNKESGMIVHPGHGTGPDTLVHALLHHTDGKLSLLGGAPRPGVVHRLDRETSGLIVFAKSDRAYLELIRMFSEREIQKEYLALVSGAPELESGVIKAPIGRHPVNRVKMAVVQHGGRDAHTEWAIEKRFGPCTLFRCWLLTGRTHQIRVHMKLLGYPILGDQAYGYRYKDIHQLNPKRVMLHAERLVFKHPVTAEEIDLHAPLPSDFLEQMAVLEK